MKVLEVVLMQVIYLLLLIAGLVCFALAAFGVRPEASKINFTALGLAAWILVPLIQMAQRV